MSKYVLEITHVNILGNVRKTFKKWRKCFCFFYSLSNNHVKYFIYIYLLFQLAGHSIKYVNVMLEAF